MGQDGSAHIKCPDCGAEIVVDLDSGEIVLHTSAKRPPAGGRSFDSLMQELDDGKRRAEDTFEREKEAMKHRERLLQKRFEEAMRRVDDDDEAPPPRPFDLD